MGAFGDLVHQARAAHGLSLDDLAKLTSVSPGRLRRCVYVRPTLTRAECHEVEARLSLGRDVLWLAQLRDPEVLDPEVRAYYEAEIAAARGVTDLDGEPGPCPDGR